jgi:hypothetical protein
MTLKEYNKRDFNAVIQQTEGKKEHISVDLDLKTQF